MKSDNRHYISDVEHVEENIEDGMVEEDEYALYCMDELVHYLDDMVRDYEEWHPPEFMDGCRQMRHNIRWFQLSSFGSKCCDMHSPEEMKDGLWECMECEEVLFDERGER